MRASRYHARLSRHARTLCADRVRRRCRQSGRCRLFLALLERPVVGLTGAPIDGGMMAGEGGVALEISLDSVRQGQPVNGVHVGGAGDNGVAAEFVEGEDLVAAPQPLHPVALEGHATQLLQEIRYRRR